MREFWSFAVGGFAVGFFGLLRYWLYLRIVRYIVKAEGAAGLREAHKVASPWRPVELHRATPSAGQGDQSRKG